MAYRRPGVTVSQEFVGLAPALAAFALPSVAVGPAYQLVDDDTLGTYSGAQQVYAYAGLQGGALVDLSSPDPEEKFPITRKHISVVLRDPVLEVSAEVATGEADGVNFTDPTASVFANVLVGDLIALSEQVGQEIVAAQTDGVTSVANPNRLTAGTAGQFANVLPGDSVVVTGGTNTTPGTYTVSFKLSDDEIQLDGNVNDGVGASTDVAYSITGTRGSDSKIRVKAKTDDNNLVLESPVPNSPQTLLTYSVQRESADITLARVDALPGNGFLAEELGVTLPAALTSGGLTIVSGNVESSYRALRTDLAAEVREYGRISDIEAVFGVGQIAPANPLAYGLSIMLQNTVTPVNGLGLAADFDSDEALAFTKATDVLALTEMYAIALLTQNNVVAATYKNHVEQLSLPDKKLERVAIFSSSLVDTEILAESTTTETALNGSRTVVNTQVDGEADISQPTTLTDNTPDAFLNVNQGDKVTVQAGTNVIAGTYTVQSITDANNIVLDSAIISAGTSSDFQYYIQRPDGIDADGQTLYDRNASFISNGVSAGHYVTITAPSGIASRYKIGSVESDTQLTLAAAIPGVASSENPVTYQIDRDLTKTEQADQIASFSSSLGSRRMVHVWPDVVEAPVGQTTEKLPGYYLTAVVAALTTGLPTQQGFTNLTVSGFLGFDHSTGYFTEEQLDAIAGGGTMVFAQAGAGQNLYVRHQLTTDVSAIKFQEFSVTKNVDFIAKFIRGEYAKFIGQYNIIDTTLDALRTTAEAIIVFLRDTSSVPRFGGVIRGGSLATLEESETQIDTVNMRFKFNIPIPLNNIDIVIEV